MVMVPYDMVMVCYSMVMAIHNGDKTYSKTPFKESKHKRGSGGTFSKKDSTEKDKVAYHHKFSSGSHPRGKDGSFSNSAKYVSSGAKVGQSRYGK